MIWTQVSSTPWYQYPIDESKPASTHLTDVLPQDFLGGLHLRVEIDLYPKLLELVRTYEDKIAVLHCGTTSARLPLVTDHILLAQHAHRKPSSTISFQPQLLKINTHWNLQNFDGSSFSIIWYQRVFRDKDLPPQILHRMLQYRNDS